MSRCPGARGRSLLSAAVLTLSGCTYIDTVNHYDLDHDQLERYKAMEIVGAEQRANGHYRSLGEIRGLSCLKNLNAPQYPREEDAVDQLRLRASRAGATAISPPVCQRSTDMDWANNCWQTVICAAEILVKEAPP